MTFTDGIRLMRRASTPPTPRSAASARADRFTADVSARQVRTRGDTLDPA
ncbi:hypothetical protein [Streptomyces roseoviridis]